MASAGPAATSKMVVAKRGGIVSKNEIQKVSKDEMQLYETQRE